jgi:uncharacterized protein (UPF0332 family)
LKESLWGECLNYNSAVTVTPDREKSKSLIETAEERIESSAKVLTGKSANYIFEDYYSSILEMLHALVLLDGYKVSNHICLGYYLRDVLRKDEMFRIFDDSRYKRNSLVYYGKRMDFDTAKATMEKTKKLIKELKKIIDEKLK